MKRRNYNLDKFRGFTIISMVLFHLMYNINYYWYVSRYDGTLLNKIWQISIAGSFFLISGITANFLNSNENIKRGFITSLIGFAITLVTYIFAKDQFILRGVLNGLGASMIIVGLIQKLGKNHPYLGFLFLILFVASYNIPRGILYQNDFFKKFYDSNLFVIGFPSKSFYSNDYFPLIPWIFMFLTGFEFGAFLKTQNFFNKFGSDSIIAKIGRHSMKIYLAHQVVLYPLVTLIYKFAK